MLCEPLKRQIITYYIFSDFTRLCSSLYCAVVIVDTKQICRNMTHAVDLKIYLLADNANSATLNK